MPGSSDRLSHLRTHLANERTILAYVRTALGFLATGIAAFGFGQFHPVVGWFFVSVGVVLTGLGFFRFFQTKNKVNGEDEE